MPLEVPEVQYTAPEKDDVYQLEKSELKELMTDIEPKELVKLFVSKYEIFLKKFVLYITSEKMKQKYADEINWEYYTKDMKAYFENMDERVMKSKNLPLPLVEGYEDIFAVGMLEPAFKKEIYNDLQGFFTYDKKTDTFVGILDGSDIGGSITGKILILYKSLYNNRGVRTP